MRKANFKDVAKAGFFFFFFLSSAWCGSGQAAACWMGRGSDHCASPCRVGLNGSVWPALVSFRSCKCASFRLPKVKQIVCTMHFFFSSKCRVSVESSSLPTGGPGGHFSQGHSSVLYCKWLELLSLFAVHTHKVDLAFRK